VSSAEDLYNRLMIGTPEAYVLPFDVIALLAVNKDGSLIERKLRALIKLFRPDREGNLSLLDFVKSIDSVYKDMRILRASVANSSKVRTRHWLALSMFSDYEIAYLFSTIKYETQMDRAFEKIVDVFFYILIIIFFIAALGKDPLYYLAYATGFLIAVAFIIGSACSSFFEGLLMVFVRRPYDIGDRVHFSDSTQDTDLSGSPGKCVALCGVNTFGAGPSLTISSFSVSVRLGR